MRFENSNLEGGGRRGGGGRGVGLGAGADGLADLIGVQVVVDETVDDVGEVALDDGVADDLQGAAQQSADLVEDKTSSICRHPTIIHYLLTRASNEPSRRYDKTL